MTDSAPHNRRSSDPWSHDGETTSEEEATRRAEELEGGILDPDELSGEPEWWDEGSDDEC